MDNHNFFEEQITPFISSDSYIADSEVEGLMDLESNTSQFEDDVPFLSVYETDDLDEEHNVEDDYTTELIAELYDEELNQDLYELANEAAELYESELHESEFNSESEIQSSSLQHQLVEDYTTLFSKELDHFFNALIESTEKEDISQKSEPEIDAWVESFVSEYEIQTEEELFEEETLFEHGLFKRIRRGFKKLRKKVKNVAKKVVKKTAKAVKAVAKRVKKVGKKGFKAIKKVGKFIWNRILKRVFRKLKKYMVRFLKKILNSKLVKKYLPPRYRELFTLIRQLMNKKRGKRLSRNAWKKIRRKIKGRRKEVEGFENFVDEYAYLQHELDVHIANLVSSESETEEDQLLASYEQEDYYPDEHILKELDSAREKFVNEMSHLGEDEDPSPHVEHFVLAILNAIRVILRPVVAAYGRTKTINNIIAPLLFRILKKFIKGKNKRPILRTISRILGDIGLKVLLKMEVTEEIQNETAADAIANIAEETLSQVVQLPAYVYEDDELAQAYVMETFEQMAGANLPPVLPESQYLANPDLRESSVKGSWIAYRNKRRRRNKRRCKKFSKIFRKKLSRHLLKEINTFGEASLAEFFVERMDLPIAQELEANIHLYEAMNDADLYQVSQSEVNLPGLSYESEFGYQLLHPLTPVNAGLLLGEPGLGRKIDPIFLASPRLIRPGQRFFYLEIENARPKIITDRSGGTSLRRLSEMSQTLNFIRKQIRINLFVSERNAQEIASKLRSRQSYGPALSQTLKIFDRGMRSAFSSILIHKRTKIVHPFITPGPNSGLEFSKVVPEYIQELFKEKLKHWVAISIGGFIKQSAQKFITATENEEDGVTIRIIIDNPPGFPELRKIISSNTMNIPHDFLDGKPDNINVSIKPGFNY